MIARLWSARTTPQNWPAYERHFIDNVIPELRAVAGYLSSQLLKRDSGVEHRHHFLAILGRDRRLRRPGPRSRHCRSERRRSSHQLRPPRPALRASARRPPIQPPLCLMTAAQLQL